VKSLDEKPALAGAAIERHFRIQIRLASPTEAGPESKCA
jgi:hypothetical protein